MASNKDKPKIVIVEEGFMGGTLGELCRLVKSKWKYFISKK